MHLAEHHQTEDRLDDIDRMAAEHQAAGALGDLESALEHLSQHLEGGLVPRPAHQTEREQRSAPHGVDVAQGVGRRDGPPCGRIVHDRGEEVHRGHQGAVAREAEDGGIVAGGRVDQYPRVGHAGETAQDLRQVHRAELAGAAGPVGKRGEADSRLSFGGWLRHARFGKVWPVEVTPALGRGTPGHAHHHMHRRRASTRSLEL